MDPKFTSEELQAFVQKTLEQWHVPGVALAVVKDDQVILCKGFGKRDPSRDLPVEADTLFPIASCTKAFTAMCVGILVDEGKLEWDKPVRDYLPTFKLDDDFATERMTPRDLLCHRSGLPRHDFLWYASNFTRKEVVDRLKYVEPSKDFRSTFQYQNMMFMVAGYLVGEITGMTWEAFVKQRIFDPLGMNRSNTSSTITQQDPNHGRPYLYRKGELKEIPYYEADEQESTGPAGTIVSCVQDLARWLLVHTHGGKSGDLALISPNNLAEMHKPHIFIDDPQTRQRFGFEFTSYGLGWGLHSHKGQVLIQHGGAIDGFSSLVSFLPRYNLGIAVLSNGDSYHNAIPSVISYTIYDRLLDLEATDWNTKYKKLYDEGLEAEDRSKQQSTEERRQAPPSHPIEDYLGKYEHPGYGIYTVRKEGEALHLVTNDKIEMGLEPYHYDIFEANFERFDMRLKLSFSTDLKGNVSGFSTQMEPEVKEVFFTRLADQRLNDPAFLAQFTGNYDFMELTLSIGVKEGKDGKGHLFASLPGQEYELVPYQGTEYALKGMTGFSITFKSNEKGEFNQAVLTQPGAVFIANRK